MESNQVLFLFYAILNTVLNGVVAFTPPSTLSLTFQNVKQLTRPSLAVKSPTFFSVPNIALYNSKSDEIEGDGNDDEPRDGNESDLSWMKDSMGVSEEDISKEEASPTSLSLKSGISGFAVDAELGFVCVLVPDSNDDEEGNDDERGNNNNDTFTYAVVSPTDKEKLSSPESLCLVQLAGGLDLGAAVFPPETLARLVAAELEGGEDDREINVDELRSKITLLGVTATKNEKYSPNEQKKDDSDITGSSTPERDAAIQEGSPKMLPAIRNLPGLAGITKEQIIAAMQIHADASGKLDQQGFSKLLGTLRGDNVTNRMEDQKVKFRITVSVLEDDYSSSPSQLVDVDHVTPFQAIALAMRYKVTVTVSDECFGDGSDERDQDLLTRFSAFKPAQELVEDAKVMDGFISKNFFKAIRKDDEL